MLGWGKLNDAHTPFSALLWQELVFSRRDSGGTCRSVGLELDGVQQSREEKEMPLTPPGSDDFVQDAQGKSTMVSE